MIALSLPEIKDFMNKLLCTDTFGHFLLKEAVILGSVTWSLDGTIQPDFYSSDEADALGLTGLSFLPFEQVRPQCFDLIKGRRTPSYFKFVFLLSPKNLERTLLSTHSSFTPEDITGMFINLKFQQKKTAPYHGHFVPDFLRGQEPRSGVGFPCKALSHCA